MPAESEPDETRPSLLEAIKHLSNDDAWNQFMSSYRPRVLDWLLRRGLSAADAEDVCQEVLKNLVRSIPQFEYDPKKSFRGYLNWVTHNAWVDWVKECVRRPARVGDSKVRALAEDERASEDFSSDFADKEWLEEACRRAMQTTQRRYVEAFLLKEKEGLSRDEIARRMGIGAASVYVFISRGREAILAELRALDEPPSA